MINYRPYPTEVISIAPPRDSQADPMTRLDQIRDRFARNDGLPFADVLTEARIHDALDEHGVTYRDRVFSPVTTIRGFLSQVLSEDHSCRDAVTRVIAHRAANGLGACSPNTASYCNARGRVPTGVLRTLAKRTAQELQAGAAEDWKWNGRSVFIADGSHVSMPDTPENQAAYPQPSTQGPGLGFPIARILVIFSLAVGTVLEAAMGPYQGKQTSELALLRQVVAQFQAGDIALADRFFCSYWVIAELKRRGVDVVVRLHQRRKADFRRGRRLGRGDHLVTWTKPAQVPAWMTRVEYEAMPGELSVREIRVRVTDKTKRVRTLIIVTTLADARVYRADGVRGLYRQRWEAELNLRSLKCVMKMDVLRTKTPEMVRKEVAMHLLGYNLIRGIMAEAVRGEEVAPRRLSFAGALHTVRSFEEAHLYDPERIRA